MSDFGHSTVRGLLAVTALVLAAELRAQHPGEVSGRVTYSGTRQGIGKVLVLLPGAGLSTFTDTEGRFRVENVPAGVHELVPTLLGCQLGSRSIQLAPGQRLEVSFDLSSPVINLQGIVVTAVSAETPEAELPFSVGRVSPSSSDPAGGRSIGALLQGRVAGAKVLFGSGQPGSNPSIQLRAPVSIQQGNSPLLVVDGVITNGAISEIDPMDVEHVQVLKGASASAGYGSRGEAGVIEIRTRRGPSVRARPAGPLIIVDGVATSATLGDIDPAEIEAIRKLDGAAAAVLYGPSAEAGVILVSTTGAPPEASRPPFCVVPNWIR